MNKATDMRRIKLTLVLLAFFIFSSAGHCFAKAKVAILPWKVNAAGNVDFLKDALADMLSSRVGSGEAAEVMRADIVKAAISEAKAGEAVTDASALAAGAKLKADYVLYGSLTVLGSAISLDAKFLNVKDGVATPFYSKGNGIDSIIGLADKLSADVTAALSPAATQAVKTTQAPVPAQAPVATQPTTGFIVTAPVPVPVPVQQSSASAQPKPAEPSGSVGQQAGQPMAAAAAH
jgi:TolB-like protein